MWGLVKLPTAGDPCKCLEEGPLEQRMSLRSCAHDGEGQAWTVRGRAPCGGPTLSTGDRGRAAGFSLMEWEPRKGAERRFPHWLSSQRACLGTRGSRAAGGRQGGRGRSQGTAAERRTGGEGRSGQARRQSPQDLLTEQAGSEGTAKADPSASTSAAGSVE